MTVFIHLNQGLNQSYLLTFPADIRTGQIRAIIGSGYNKAVPMLMNKSEIKVQIPCKTRKKARSSADFILTEGCVSERLA